MSMSVAERDAFLREIRIGTLCTLSKDGAPNALPLWYEWDGEKIRMFSSRQTGKVRRLRTNPRACLSVQEPVGAKEAWVTVEGTVTIVDKGGKDLALKLANIYYTGQRREAVLADWGATKAESWVLLELTPTHIRTY